MTNIEAFYRYSMMRRQSTLAAYARLMSNTHSAVGAGYSSPAQPEPPTPPANDRLKLVVETTANYNKSGIYLAKRDDVSKPVVIDWGDGTIEQVDGDVSQKVHEYATVGAFNVTINNIKSYAASTNNSSWYNTISQNMYTLKEVVAMPDSVKSIRVQSFFGCTSLTSVTIPDSVTSIEASAFSDCSGLVSVAIPNSVISIGYHAFSSCSGLLSFSVAADNPSYKSVSGLLLSKDGKTLIQGVNGDVTIPDGVTSIMHDAFYNCNGLTSVTIPDSVTSIGTFAFYKCINLTNVTIPDSVTSIGKHAFIGCSSLTSVTIPDSVTSIGESTFSGCTSLTSVTIPDSVTSIGDQAFSHCHCLTNVTIPDSVTNIDSASFSNCISLTRVVFDGNAPKTVINSFHNTNSSCTAYVRENSTGWDVDIPGTWKGIHIAYLTYTVTFEIGQYGTHTGGGELMQEVLPEHTAIEPQVIGIDTGWEFTGWDNDVTAAITADMTFTAQYNELIPHKTTVTYADGSISDILIDGVLTEDKIPNLNNAVSIDIGYPVKTIAANAFRNCAGLTSMTIPTNVIDIGSYAFYNCSNLIEYHMLGMSCDTVKARALNWGLGLNDDESKFLVVVYCKDGVVVINDGSEGSSSSGDDSGLTLD